MLRQFTMTLTGSAQSLSSSIKTDGAFSTWNDPPIKQIGIQLDTAATHSLSVGDADVGTPFGCFIPAPVSTVPTPPLILDFPKDTVVRLSDIYVKGTNTEIVHGWVVF